MDCRYCLHNLLSKEDLCFYYMNGKSVHLTVKHELSIIRADKISLKGYRISCPQCKVALGSNLRLGPHALATWTFGSKHIVLLDRALEKNERWHEVYRQPPFHVVCSRNIDDFFGYLMTSETGETSETIETVETGETYETNSPKRLRLDDGRSCIVFPDPDNPSDFAYEDILMSDRTPYDYQITSYIEALQRDLVVVLPTGYGKTLIASLVAAKMKSLNPDYMILFIVDRIPLVFQQGESISFDTHLRVYLLNRESHNPQKQKKLLNGEYDVLVSTAGAYRNFQNKLSMDKFCYVIFDECHHATKEHDYVNILKSIKQCDPSRRPRVLGLTASPPSIKGNEDANLLILSQFKAVFFDAPICHNLCLKSQERDDAKMEKVIIPPDPILLKQMRTTFKQELNRLEKIINELFEIDIIKCGNLEVPSNRANLSRILTLEILKYSDIPSIKAKVDSMKKICEVLESTELLGTTYADGILNGMKFYDKIAHEKIRSSRLSALLEILNAQENSKIIIFVQTRRTAQILWKVLDGIPRIKEKYSPLKIVGQYGLFGMSWENEQDEIIKTFSQGTCNLLVSTSVLEEGLDVPCCDVVIRFDAVKTLTSYKQSRGRARKWERSKFILILSEEERTMSDEISKQESIVKNVLSTHFTDRDIPSSKTRIIQDELDSLTHHTPNDFAIKSSDCAVEFYLSGTHELYDMQDSIAEFLKEKFLPPRHIDIANPEKKWKSRGIFPGEDTLLLLGILTQSRNIYETYKQLTIEWSFCLEDVEGKVWTRTEIHQAEKISQDKLRCKWPIQKIMWGKFNDRCTFLASEIKNFGENEASFELVKESHLQIRISSELIEIPLASMHRFILADWRKRNIRLYIPLRHPPPIRISEEDRQTSDTSPNLCYFGSHPVIRLTIAHDKSNWSQLWVLLHTSNIFPVPLFESRVNKRDSTLSMETDENLADTPNYWDEPMQDCVWLFSILKANRNVCVSNEVVDMITREVSQAQTSTKDLLNQKHALSQLSILMSDVRTHYFVDLVQAFTEQLDYIRENDPIFVSWKGKKNYRYIECAIVTPSRVIPLHPILNQCNRLYRKYPNERFLNLAFRDENEGDLDKKAQVLERVKNIMENGISINGAEFHFLVCSSSQLRSKRAIFIQIRDTEQSEIRRKLKDMRFQLIGKCDIKNETKFLSRLGLFCTSDQPTGIEIKETETHCLPDIKADNGLMLTDGAGKIKKSLAEQVFKTIDSKNSLSNTSALQIRLAGLKGVFTIVDGDTDPDFNNNLQHCNILYRKSMKKIEWTHSTLCIVKAGKYNKLYLNVQMLNLLTSLRDRNELWSPEPRIRALYSQALQKFASVFTDIEETRRELESNLPGYFKETSALQLFDIQCEPFFFKMLRCIYSHNIKYLIEKVHIPIPMEYGCILMGIPDPIGVLDDGEVFVTFQGVNGNKEIKQGRVLTYKNPCMHPGDLLTPRAVDRAEFHHLHNVIVFPIRGSTSLPACTSGGDLDGDEFAIIWDSDLIPPETAVHEPLNYDKSTEPYKQQLAANSDDTALLQDDPEIQHRLTEGYCQVMICLESSLIAI